MKRTIAALTLSCAGMLCAQSQDVDAGFPSYAHVDVKFSDAPGATTVVDKIGSGKFIGMQCRIRSDVYASGSTYFPVNYTIRVTLDGTIFYPFFLGNANHQTGGPDDSGSNHWQLGNGYLLLANTTYKTSFKVEMVSSATATGMAHCTVTYRLDTRVNQPR